MEVDPEQTVEDMTFQEKISLYRETSYMINSVVGGRFTECQAERPAQDWVTCIKTVELASRLRGRVRALLNVGAGVTELEGTATSPGTRVGKAEKSAHFLNTKPQWHVATTYLT